MAAASSPTEPMRGRRVGALLTPGSEIQRGGPPQLLRGLNKEAAAEILAFGTPKVLYKGARLFSQGTPQDGIFLVESGRIEVFYTAASGREITLAYWHPGNFVGGPDVFDSGLHVWSGAAVVNSSVLHLPGAMLRKMILKTPALGLNVIEGLAFKGRCYSGLAQMLGTRSVTERLAHLLLQLAELYGIEEDEGVLIATSFTHADLANMIGATRQWVTMNIARLTRNGVLTTRQANILIVNRSQLENIRNGGSAEVHPSGETRLND